MNASDLSHAGADAITTAPVWDLPLRIFHWSLVAAVAALLVSGEIGGLLIDWHGKIGLAVVGLLVFRLVWGLVGSTYARFASFLPNPGALRAYLKGEWQGLGHNPLGALSVFAMLGLLMLQAASGLFANDDIAFQGPLAPLVDKGLGDRLTGAHHLGGTLLLILIGLHVAAILFYRVVRGKDLVRPMLTGRAEAHGPVRPLRGGGLPALALAVGLALLAVAGLDRLAATPATSPQQAPAAAAAPW